MIFINMYKSVISCSGLLLAALLLSACGQKGPLYLSAGEPGQSQKAADKSASTQIGHQASQFDEKVGSKGPGLTVQANVGQ